MVDEWGSQYYNWIMDIDAPLTDREIYIKAKDLGLDVSTHDHNLQIIGKLLVRIAHFKAMLEDTRERAMGFQDAVISGRVRFRRVEDTSDIRIVTGTCYVGDPTLIYYRARDKWDTDIVEAYIIEGEDVQTIGFPETGQFKVGYAFGVVDET